MLRDKDNFEIFLSFLIQSSISEPKQSLTNSSKKKIESFQRTERKIAYAGIHYY